jgi:hypothetical protein
MSLLLLFRPNTGTVVSVVPVASGGPGFYFAEEDKKRRRLEEEAFVLVLIGATEP